MRWIDWLIVTLPLLFVLGLAVYSRKYIHGVADYLAAGRVAGRYMIAIGSMETSIGVMVLVGNVEIQYLTGYALTFWSAMIVPVAMMMTLDNPLDDGRVKGHVSLADVAILGSDFAMATGT